MIQTATQFILSSLMFLFLLGFSVFVHEAGHFLVATGRGISTQGFYIGVPIPYPYIRRGAGKIPIRVGFYRKYVDTWKGTPIYVSPLLIGGFIEPIRDEADPRSFQSATPLTKSLVLIAGPLANLLVAGLMIGVYHFYQFPGIPAAQLLFESVIRIGQNVAVYTVEILSSLLNLFSGNLVGPIGIFQAVQKETKTSIGTGSWLPFVSMLAGLNLSLMVVNLLPIGTLDGAKLILAGVEWVTRKRYIMLERIFSALGFAVLAFVGVVITAGDIGRLFR